MRSKQQKETNETRKWQAISLSNSNPSGIWDADDVVSCQAGPLRCGKIIENKIHWEDGKVEPYEC